MRSVSFLFAFVSVGHKNKSFNFYNYDARDDEFEDAYNDGYCAFAYHVCTDSNTISYIVFESNDLQYMNMESALSLFPQFENKNQVVYIGWTDEVPDVLYNENWYK